MTDNNTIIVFIDTCHDVMNLHTPLQQVAAHALKLGLQSAYKLGAC